MSDNKNINETSISDRPVSRRGLRPESSFSSIASASVIQQTIPPPSATYRAGMMSAIHRGMDLRPQSSLRINTASRTASAISPSIIGSNVGGSGRIGTALNYAGSMMTERPITQHGLSGLPTSSYGRNGIGTSNSGSGMRLIKDKRYWQVLLQSKINEITQEITRLISEKANMDREKSAKRMYDKKVKEATKELNELQIRLSDVNITLDSFNSGITRQNVQREAAAIRERNEDLQNQVELLFGERQIKNERNKQLEQEIEIEKNKINDMIFSLSIDEQAKYRQLQDLAESYKNQNLQKQNQLETLISKKQHLNDLIMGSHSKVEVAQLKQKLHELKMNWTKLLEEEENKLTPEQEREKIIREVRANNQALKSIEHQMKIIENQLSEKKEQCQLIEQTLEEGDSEHHTKYKELRRRDETITDFLEKFPEQIKTEKKNVELLKNQIAYAIEQITLQGINMKPSITMSNKLHSIDEQIDLNSQNGLLKEYKKFSIQLKQLQFLEKKTESQLKQLLTEKADLINQIRNYSNLESVRSEATENMEQLTTTLGELEKKKKITEDVVQEAKKKNHNIKDQLRNNELYQQVSYLEENLIHLIQENKVIQETVNENKQENNYFEIKENVENIIKDINRVLIEENKSGGIGM